MKISLIMATLNRSNDLKSFLTSLDEQTYKKFELIIVDQSNKECFLENSLSIAEHDFDIKHIHTTIKGLSRARNIGFKLITGDVVCFPDDDCTYPNHLLEYITSLFLFENQHVILGTYIDKSTGLRAHKNVCERTVSYYNHNLDGCCSVGIFINLNEINNSLIHFDENIGAGTKLPAAEDKDLIIKLIKSGLKCLFIPSVFVWHPVIRENIQGKNLLYRHQARSYMLQKHIDYYPIFFQQLFGVIKDLLLLFRLKKNIVYRLKGMILFYKRKKVSR